MSLKTKTSGNLALVGFDDIFKSSVTDVNEKSVVDLPLSELNPPEFHPFHVLDDDSISRKSNNRQ